MAFVEHFVCSCVAKSSKREKRLSLSHNGIRESTRDTAAAVGHLPTSTSFTFGKLTSSFGGALPAKIKKEKFLGIYTAIPSLTAPPRCLPWPLPSVTEPCGSVEKPDPLLTVAPMVLCNLYSEAPPWGNQSEALPVWHYLYILTLILPLLCLVPLAPLLDFPGSSALIHSMHTNPCLRICSGKKGWKNIQDHITEYRECQSQVSNWNLLSSKYLA